MTREEKLENLLTSLVQRGRKPKGREVVSIKLDKEFTKSEGKTVFYCSCNDWFWFYADLRRLVSLESGLWQFCVEQKFYKKIRKRRLPYDVSTLEVWPDYSSIHDHQYRLLESALLPEEELGQFLIDNIIITCNLK